MNSPLEGTRVLDLSHHISGPYCGAILADMGAEVIRIEVPGGDPERIYGPLSPRGDSYIYVNRARNKKTITLNLRNEKGQEIFKRLVEKSDIVLENNTLRDKQRLGLNFESLSKINGSIIIASISAFGLTGPNKNRTGFDPTAQSMAGLMSFNGFPGDPPIRTAVAWVDYATALHMACGILLALRYRDVTGKGQTVDVCLADIAAGLGALHGVYTEYEQLGIERKQSGNVSPYSFSDTFEAKDGGWVFISLTRNSIFNRFIKTLGIEDEIDGDPRFESDMKRMENNKALYEVIAPWVAERTVPEVVSALEAAKVPCSVVNTVGQAFSEPQFNEREILVDIEHKGAGKMKTLGTLIKLSESPGKIKCGAGIIGQDNTEIYKNFLGLSETEISALQEEGVI